MRTKNIFKDEFISRLIIMCVGLVAVAIGTAFMMKANLGQNTMSALALNIEYVTGVRAGTILNIINYICFVLQVIILRKEFKIIQVLQLVVSTVFGVIINFISYDFPLTANIGSDIYILQLSLFFISIVIIAFGISAMIKADLLFLPFEGFFNAVVYKLNVPFEKARPFADGALLVGALILMVMYKIPNTTVREGTVIFLLVFGRVVGFFNNRVFSDGDKLINIKWKKISFKTQ